MTENSHNSQRIAKNTLFLYMRMLLTLCISLYTSRIVLDALGAENYGIYNVVGGFVTMFSVINGAMTAASQRFISFELGKGAAGNIKKVFCTSCAIHIVLALIILFAAETIGLWFLNTHMQFPAGRHGAANWVFQLSTLTFLVNVVSVPYNAAIIAYERMKAFAYVSIIEVVLKLVVCFLIVWTAFDKLIVYAVLLAMIAITIRIIYSIYCNRKLDGCRFDWTYDKSIGKEMFSFASWNLIGSLAGVAREQGINVLLNLFFSVTVNAARGIAYQVLGAINGFVGNFQLAMNPQIVKSYSAHDTSYMFNVVFRGSKFSCMMLFCLSLPVIMEAPWILSVWLKQVPHYTDIFLMLAIVNAILDSLSGTLIAAMHASGKVRDYQIIVGCTSLLTLPVAYGVLKCGFPPYYAVIVGIVISFACLFARLILLRKTIGLSIRAFFYEVLVPVSLSILAALVLPVAALMTLRSGIIANCFIIALSFSSALVACYLLGFTQEERKFVKEKAIAFIKQHKR